MLLKKIIGKLIVLSLILTQEGISSELLGLVNPNLASSTNSHVVTDGAQQVLVITTEVVFRNLPTAKSGSLLIAPYVSSIGIPQILQNGLTYLSSYNLGSAALIGMGSCGIFYGLYFQSLEKGDFSGWVNGLLALVGYGVGAVFLPMGLFLLYKSQS